MKIAAIGCGNVGFNTLRAFQARGHEVRGFDTSPEARTRVEQFFGADTAASTIDQLDGSDLIFICVPTDPIERTGAADLSILNQVVNDISALERIGKLRAGGLVQRSTCPPGTARRMARTLNKIRYAVNPSFLSKATCWEDSDRPPRIAYWGDGLAGELLAQAYSDFPSAPIYVGPDAESVELLKYVENTIDTVLISLWNEYLEFADRIEMPRSSFLSVLEALPERQRFGSVVRIPGGGAFSKWCLPKDLRAFIFECAQAGSSHHVLSGALNVNENVAQSSGENQYSTADLLGMEDNKVYPTELARTLIDRSRKTA